MSKILCLIPARGGSKGLPQKNIRQIAGRPLIAYAILAAISVREVFQRVILSTDSQEIADISLRYGVEVPFLRPPELADDLASSMSVAQHAVRHVEASDRAALDWVLLLQPTNPLVNKKDLLTVVEIAESRNCDTVVSVCNAKHAHPRKMKQLVDGFLKPFFPDCPEPSHRHELVPDVWQRNGSIYMVKRDVLMNENTMYGHRICPYIMPRERSVDIDTIFDFELAEFLLERQSTRKTNS